MTPLAPFVLMDSRAFPHGVLIVVLPIVALNLLDAFLTLWHIDSMGIRIPITTLAPRQSIELKK